MLDQDGLYDPRLREQQDEDPTPEPAPGGYRIRSDDTWALARAAYLDGETAEQVCDRFDLSLSAFRERARKGGWRRCDQADPEPLPVDAGDDIDFDAGYGDLAEHALRQLRRAMARGRVSAAGGWMRLHDRLGALARAEIEADVEAERRAAAALEAARPHSVAHEQLRERIEARQREAEAYVARRDAAAAVDNASRVALRVTDLARRVAATDPRDSAGRAAIDLELNRLQTQIRAGGIPHDPHDPHCVSAWGDDPP